VIKAHRRSPQIFDFHFMSTSSLVVVCDRVRCDFQVFDCATNSWHHLPPPHTPRSAFAIASRGSEVFIAGGRRLGLAQENEQKELTSMEVLDLSKSGKWRVLPSHLPGSRSWAAALIADNYFPFYNPSRDALQAKHQKLVVRCVEHEANQKPNAVHGNFQQKVDTNSFPPAQFVREQTYFANTTVSKTIESQVLQTSIQCCHPSKAKAACIPRTLTKKQKQQLIGFCKSQYFIAATSPACTRPCVILLNTSSDCSID
jgi:hypothetical protein